MYDAVIKRVSDGVERVCPQKADWSSDSGWPEDPNYSWYWWEGNASCDCNREIEFHREDPAYDIHDARCSEGKYLVLRFILPDGRVILGPDAGT